MFICNFICGKYFQKKDLSGYRLNVNHSQYISHTLKFKYKPFKVNLLGPIFLTGKHKIEQPEEFAKSVLLFFKPWLKSPWTLKSHNSWIESLDEWKFYDRHKSDSRWYLKMSEEGITPTHPFIENIQDMFEGQDRAMRQRAKYLENLQKHDIIENISEIEAIKSNKDNSEKLCSIPDFVTNSDIIYLPVHNLRKTKISSHIQMVTNDVLKAFRPNINNSETILSEEIKLHHIKSVIEIMNCPCTMG